jgi:hypothetical protein
MSTLPQLVPFQVPNFNLGDTLTQMARLGAYESQRRTSELEQEEKRTKLDRERLWRSTIAGAFPTTDPRAPAGLNAMAPQPQAQAPPQAPPVTGGLAGPQPIAQGPAMGGAPGMAINPQTGEWSTPGGMSAPPVSPMAPGGLTRPQPGMPSAITALAQPPAGAQPPLQGGGFTQTTPGTGGSLPTAPTGQGGLPQGLATPQPSRPLEALVPGLMPMPDMRAVQRAFAIDPEKTSQWYGAYLTQRGKQLEEVTRNNELVHQVTGAMLDNPAYYKEGLEYLRAQGVPVPKNMPAEYNPAFVKFHYDTSGKRLDPLDEARRQQALAQTELAKAQTADVPRRTELESARLGLQGTTATMNDELRAMGVNPLTATTAERQQAQKNIQAREVEAKEKEGLAGARARTQADVDARQNQTIAEAFKGETTSLYDTRTLQPLDARMKVKDYETLPAGQTKMFSPEVRKQVEQLNSAVPIVAQLQTHIDKIYGPGGVLAKLTPDDRALITSGTPISQRFLDQLEQKYPELVQAQRFIDANAGALARALAGETGAMNEGDVERAKAMTPSLTTALQIWPPSKIGVRLPDTRAVALNNMNSIVDMINARGQTLSGNDQYAHPKLHRYQTAAEAQQASGAPAPVTPPPRPQDIAPEGTPAVRLNPNLPPVPGQATPPPTTQPPQAPAPEPVPAPGPPLFPQPQIRMPGEGPAPGRQSAAPTAPERQRVVGWFERPEPPPVMTQADIAEAMRQTGRSRGEVERAARARGYTMVA